MGSRVSPSWQQRLAAGEVYWPTAGPAGGECGRPTSPAP